MSGHAGSLLGFFHLLSPVLIPIRFDATRMKSVLVREIRTSCFHSFVGSSSPGCFANLCIGLSWL